MSDHLEPAVPPPASPMPGWAKLLMGLATLVVVGLVVVIVLLVTGGDDGNQAADPDAQVVASDDADTFDVVGRLTLGYDGFEYQGKACFGWKGYDDINVGTQVVIYNSTGDQIGLGSLTSGTRADGECTFTFTVNDVPVADTDLYSVEVSHRGQITFTKAEALDVALTLG